MIPYPPRHYEASPASLEYLQSMLEQLRDMAAGERLGMLTYLIEMAYVEVGDIIRGAEPSPVSHVGNSGPIQ